MLKDVFVLKSKIIDLITMQNKIEMLSLIPLQIHQIVHTKAYTVILFRAKDFSFPLYIERPIGEILQMYLRGTLSSRPNNCELISCLIRTFDITIRQIVIDDLSEATYFAKLFFQKIQDEGTRELFVEINALPTDCIHLALINNLPLYCTHEFLNKVCVLS